MDNTKPQSILEYATSTTTKKMLISDQEFMTDPKSPLKKAYL